MAITAQQDRYKALYEPTDAWTAERSSAVQRALRIAGGKWIPVPAASHGAALKSGLQTAQSKRVCYGLQWRNGLTEHTLMYV